MEGVAGDDGDGAGVFAAAPPRIAPGVTSMVGYRAASNPGELHRGMPSSTLTFTSILAIVPSSVS